MNWNPEAQILLQHEQYQQVALFYEQLIENEPEEPSHYWYLGLAYLLQGLEEEAQTTWLLVMSQGEEEELEEWTRELIDILQKEAQRQEELENYELAWLIRGHIREIAPQLIDNLLYLIDLEIKLNIFNDQKINDWRVAETLQNAQDIKIDRKIFLSIFSHLLRQANSETLNFLKAGFSRIEQNDDFVEVLQSWLNTIGKEQIQFALDISNVCAESHSEYPHIQQRLFWICFAHEQYDRALSIARKLYEYKTSVGFQIFVKYLILYVMLHRGAWLYLEQDAQEYKELLKKAIAEKHSPRFIKDPVLTVMLPLYYLADNLVETRSLQNEIARLFQAETRKSILCQPAKTKTTITTKLSIGYIGKTLRNHSIGWITRWLMHYHNHDNFKIAIYLVDQQEDNITKNWFRAKADLSHNLSADPKLIAGQIEKDEINILVDLDGITRYETCQVMALKPAPIQVSWLGFDASGLPAIDYFIADPYVLPEDAQDYYQEKIWRLPNCYIAVDGFEVAVPTLQREDLNIPKDAVIYLSTQAAFKRHPKTIALQMQILRGVPNSYFLIQGVGEEKTIKHLFTKIAEKEKFSPERLRFLPIYSIQTYRANLSIADVVLDTYPFSGGATTLDILWQGIPVVTRVGQQWASRNGYSLLTNAGLTEGVAWTDEEYIEWGIRMGKDEDLRQQIAWKLRNSRQTAPLWNAKQFTRDMEDAYQQMWAKYCQTRELQRISNPPQSPLTRGT